MRSNTGLLLFIYGYVSFFNIQMFAKTIHLIFEYLKPVSSVSEFKQIRNFHYLDIEIYILSNGVLVNTNFQQSKL